MDNFKVISKEEYIRRADEIIAAKKLKTRAGDFDFIKAAGYVKAEPVVEEKIEMPKEELAPVEPKVEIKEEPKDEDITFAYGLRKPEEDIASEDITRIKNIGDTYKGGNPKEDPKKVEVAKKEEKKEEPKLTREEFEKVLNFEVHDERLATYKMKERKEYNAGLENISLKEQEITNITNEYNRETEIGSKLQEDKKENQNVLKGINAWNLDFLSLRRNQESTKSLLDHIESYFEENRQTLNQILQEIKNNDARKETLGKAEQRAREDLAALKKDLHAYMEKVYPELKEANKTDLELTEKNEKITKLTGIQADEPKLNIVESQNIAFEPERTVVTNVRNLNEPVQAVQFVQPGIIQNDMGQGRAA